ncbi:MAG TPA: DUF6152 family protein [Gammaproteobacteria bacterium]
MRNLPLVAFGAALAAAPVAAHHSPIIFDADSVVVIEGRISRFDWTNPHSYIFVETVDAAGQTREWQVETDATPILSRNGWTSGSLVPGELVSIRANPDRRSERAHGQLIALEKADGSVLTPTAGDSNAPEFVARNRSIEGIWEQRYDSFREFRANGLNVVTTEAGTAARESYDILSENPIADCVAYPSPMIFAAPQYLNEIRILEGRVTIHNEFFDVLRTIYTDGRGHPENAERTNQGHSIGQWDGNALVVETTQFADHRSTLPGTGLPSGARKRVTERYALNEAGDAIAIDFVYEDPEFLAEPFAGRIDWIQSPYTEISAFECTLDQAVRYIAEPDAP